jgi:hypothetical protein
LLGGLTGVVGSVKHRLIDKFLVEQWERIYSCGKAEE